ncbi:galactose-1-phosphate uridylyltransferase [Candidatus Sumerlaeota bacterium]|nr:galactose-1-phosphate uridylyltransferase [Candidatus Sumerlaeota bacterium]
MELRWNPILETWVMVSAQRQRRPFMPKESCPFCPGSGKVPDQYDVYLYPNDFPHLMKDPPEPSIQDDDLLRVERAFGSCDVVLYSPDHTASITQLSREHLARLFELWRDHYRAMRERADVKYVLIFENKGDIIGVTIPHPHGQIYSYPYIPARPAKELDSARRYWESHGGACLFCAVLQKELAFEKRLIWTNEHFVAFLPSYADYPNEAHIYPRRHCGSLLDMSKAEAEDFMDGLQRQVRIYDSLFGFELPFMMGFHQEPVDGAEYPYFHFHVEFYPLHRSRDKIKYNAGSETSGGAFTNPSSPEENAEELRKINAEL